MLLQVTTLDDCKKAQIRLAAAETHRERTHNDRREKPVIGTMKCNVDAALFSESNCFGYGMRIRDAEGYFVHASSAHFEGSPSPVEAEAYGLLYTLLWLKYKGYQNVPIEVDCRQVLEAIKSTMQKQNELGLIIIIVNSFFINLATFG